MCRLHTVQDASCSDGNIDLKLVRRVRLSGCEDVDREATNCHAIHFSWDIESCQR